MGVLVSASSNLVYPDPTVFCCPRCAASLYYLEPGDPTHECGARCVYCRATWWLPNGVVPAERIPKPLEAEQLFILGVRV